MTRAGSGLIDRLADRRALRRWSRLAGTADRLSIQNLRSIRVRARALQAQVSRVLAAAEERLTLPFSGAGAIRSTFDSDWAWRPDLWRGPASPHGRASMAPGATFGEEVKVFHDCPLAENAFRQVRNTRPSVLAPFGVRLEVFGFQGSFVSLVVDLPEEGLSGLSKRHIIRVSMDIETESPVSSYVRLNFRHGPNTEQMVQELSIGDGAYVEFDLGFTSINEARIEGSWLELIFDAPELARISIHDLTLCRRPRAEV